MHTDSSETSTLAPLPVIIGWIVAALWFAIDQVTKWWILENVMDPPRVIPVTAFFNLVLGWNTGVSFGMLSDSALSPWTLAFLAIAVSGVLSVWLNRTHRLLVGAGLGLVTGGALSNALNRLTHGAVMDFLDFHVTGWHWPAFNLADAGIVCGVTALVLDTFAAPRTGGSASRSALEDK